jgi:hypothetical protein
LPLLPVSSFASSRVVCLLCPLPVSPGVAGCDGTRSPNRSEFHGRENFLASSLSDFFTGHHLICSVPLYLSISSIPCFVCSTICTIFPLSSLQPFRVNKVNLFRPSLFEYKVSTEVNLFSQLNLFLTVRLQPFSYELIQILDYPLMCHVSCKSSVRIQSLGA